MGRRQRRPRLPDDACPWRAARPRSPSPPLSCSACSASRSTTRPTGQRACSYPGNRKENDDANSDPADRGARAGEPGAACGGTGQGPPAARLVRQSRPRRAGDRQAARPLHQARTRRRADRAGRSQCAAQAGGGRTGRVRRVLPADPADAGGRRPAAGACRRAGRPAAQLAGGARGWAGEDRSPTSRAARSATRSRASRRRCWARSSRRPG